MDNCKLCGEKITEAERTLYTYSREGYCEECIYGDNEIFHDGHKVGSCYECKQD